MSSKSGSKAVSDGSNLASSIGRFGSAISKAVLEQLEEEQKAERNRNKAKREASHTSENSPDSTHNETTSQSKEDSGWGSAVSDFSKRRFFGRK